MRSARRMARTSMLALGIAVAGFGLACSGDGVTGPDPAAEERSLIRQIETSGVPECIAELQRMAPLLPHMPLPQRLAEIRRIFALCHAPPAGPTSGTLEVNTSTTGTDLDPDGYMADVAGQSLHPVGINGSVSFPNLTPGSYQVELTGVADNCVVSGNNPRSVDVTAGTTASTTFDVTCEGPPGGSMGVIAFISNASGSNEVYVMNADGSNVTRLTHNTFREDHLDVSPDGTRIAFITRTTGNLERDYELWVMGIDGSNPVRLTTNLVRDNEPNWSRDGSRIVFERRVGSFDQVFVISADGTGETQLTFEDATSDDAAFSPDGNKIVFRSNRSGVFELWIMDADGSNPTALTSSSGGNEDPDWASTPSGQKIAFERSGDLFLVNPDGTGLTQITSPAGSDSDPDWSPDGTKLVFMRRADSGFPWDLYTIDADGSNPQNITNSAANETNAAWGAGSVGD